MTTADEYTWANLPTTCPDFTAHPHKINGESCYTCKIAFCSEDQGTTALMSALLDLNICCDVHQTGGFNMCVYIKTGDTTYNYANAEGFSHYIDENDDGENFYFGDDFYYMSAAKKAQQIADTMKEKNLVAVEL